MRDGKVSMTTDPLDLDDLLGEAASDEGERPWDGLPKRASIGHIPLHVMDLEESAAFYRDALGFEVQARYRQGALFLSAGGYHHHLGINVWAERMRSSQVENVVGLRSFAVCVPDAAELDREREVLADQARASGKPEEIVQKMVDGRLRKYYEETVFMEQVFVVDGETKIAKVLENAANDVGAPVAVTGFVRFALGEGIERKEEDFAAEVAATLAS